MIALQQGLQQLRVQRLDSHNVPDPQGPCKQVRELQNHAHKTVEGRTDMRVTVSANTRRKDTQTQTRIVAKIILRSGLRVHCRRLLTQSAWTGLAGWQVASFITQHGSLDEGELGPEEFDGMTRSGRSGTMHLLLQKSSNIGTLILRFLS